MIPAIEALERLKEGNARFVSGDRWLETLLTEERRNQLLKGQEPFAVILGCSDSRAPVEILFDQGLGDLFVIRVAGNIVAPSQIDSVEFAAEAFGVRLVVVLGHSRCGAIQATLAQLRQPVEQRSNRLQSIVERIRPSVEELLATERNLDAWEVERRAVRANVRVAAEALRHGSDALKRLTESGEFLVVGAEYSLETGRVDFFEGLAPPD